MAAANIRLVLTLTIDDELINDSLKDWVKTLDGNEKQIERLIENVMMRGWKPKSIQEDMTGEIAPGVLRLLKMGASVGAEYVDIEMET